MPNRSGNIILLTASIDPAVSNTPLTKITDPKIRLAQYTQVIEKLIETGAFSIIIFCENTNYEFNKDVLLNKAIQKGIELEFISFSGDHEKVKQLGKGYGEGEIIKYAIEHSKHLNDEAIFYKLTGRVFIKNIKRIVNKDHKKQTIFIRAQRNKRIIDARFFKTSVKFFKEHLMNVFTEVNDLQKHYLEMVYFEKLNGIGHIDRFSEFPFITGLSGSTGEKYDQSKYEYFKYSLLLRTGFLNVN
ncbi:MAG: hypothetical protein ACK50A_13760 [Sphingobacteriaceae bacterium]|jgi:ethanolamine utilization protein EutA (predicted chaperonin)